MKIQLLEIPGPLDSDPAGRMRGNRGKSQTGPYLVTTTITTNSWTPDFSNPIEWENLP